MLNKLQHGVPSYVTATHATSAVATKAAESGKTHYITSVLATTDKATGVVLIKDGTTVIWQGLVGAAGFYVQSFPEGLAITSGAACSVTTDGTAYCSSNLSVITI